MQIKKVFIILLIILLSSFSSALEDFTSPDNTTPTTAAIIEQQNQAALTRIQASISQLNQKMTELQANSVSKEDLNKIIPPILEYYQNETIAREMIVLVIFLVFLSTGLALLKIKRFF